MVVGGGAVAERKVELLVDCGAAVAVVSPTLTQELERLRREGVIEVLQREFRPEDVEGALLVIGATDDRAVNEDVSRAAKSRDVLVNVVDVPELCDFYVPAVIARGNLEVAINTAGSSPVLAKRLREDLEKQFGPEYGPYLELLARLRRELKTRVADRALRAQAEADFVYSDALKWLAAGKPEEAERILEECLLRYAG